MMVEWGTFFMEMILIFLIPRSSLSLWVILKCLFCQSMVIRTLNDHRVNEMMLEWLFSHLRMMINDSNEGGMMKFSKQGKCPRFFSSSFHPHSNHILSFDTHSMSEMSCHIGRQGYQVYAYSIYHFHIIQHHFSLILSPFYDEQSNFCHIGRQGYQVYAYSNSHFHIIFHHSTLILSSFAI